ncbi:hypothetical protein Tco_0093359 [Tanacetum coccineum]
MKFFKLHSGHGWWTVPLDKGFLRRSQESMVPGESLSIHLLAAPASVIGKTCSMNASCIFPQFSNELALDFEIYIASNFGFNHARCLVPSSQCQKLGLPLDTVVEGLMSNVLNEGSIYKFRVSYGVTINYGVTLAGWLRRNQPWASLFACAPYLNLTSLAPMLAFIR